MKSLKRIFEGFYVRSEVLRNRSEARDIRLMAETSLVFHEEMMMA